MCVMFVFRTQEELRVREEDQQTITVEVELKRHDSEPTISIPQPCVETRYTNNTVAHTLLNRIARFTDNVQYILDFCIYLVYTYTSKCRLMST